MQVKLVDGPATVRNVSPPSILFLSRGQRRTDLRVVQAVYLLEEGDVKALRGTTRGGSAPTVAGVSNPRDRAAVLGPLEGFDQTPAEPIVVKRTNKTGYCNVYRHLPCVDKSPGLPVVEGRLTIQVPARDGDLVTVSAVMNKSYPCVE
ncbi:hypothetical protein ES703_51259 [subsurface metagenome]